ncbi:MAG: hypothetical protein KF847_18060 [Pirellulales bacterium]|nr:hypothetical protein [Pirellulales bacterium]
MPRPSRVKCERCKLIDCQCGAGGSESVRSPAKPFQWTEWLPGGARMFTRKKLMKRTIVETVPTYRWTIEDLCADCRRLASDATVVPGAEIPPLPADWQDLPRASRLFAGSGPDDPVAAAETPILR